MKQTYNLASALQFLFLFILILSQNLYSQLEFNPVKKEELVQKSEPTSKIWEDDEYPGNDYSLGSFKVSDDDFIVTTGQFFQGQPPSSRGSFVYKGQKITNSAIWNNETIQLLATKEKLNEAINRLEAGIKFDPHFFPFRYNLGRLYASADQKNKAIEEFDYAKLEMPDYYKTYIHLANLYHANTSEELLKKAFALNQYNTQALLLLAEYSLNDNLLTRANSYLAEAQKIDPENPDVKLGLAEIKLKNKELEQAYAIFKNTNTVMVSGKFKSYNRKFHYHFGMTAYNLMDYTTAKDQFTILLKYPFDPFFNYIPYSSILKKLSDAENMSQIKNGKLKTDNK